MKSWFLLLKSLLMVNFPMNSHEKSQPGWSSSHPDPPLNFERPASPDQLLALSRPLAAIKKNDEGSNGDLTWPISCWWSAGFLWPKWGSKWWWWFMVIFHWSFRGIQWDYLSVSSNMQGNPRAQVGWENHLTKWWMFQQAHFDYWVQYDNSIFYLIVFLNIVNCPTLWLIIQCQVVCKKKYKDGTEKEKTSIASRIV